MNSATILLDEDGAKGSYHFFLWSMAIWYRE